MKKITAKSQITKGMLDVEGIVLAYSSSYLSDLDNKQHTSHTHLRITEGGYKVIQTWNDGRGFNCASRDYTLLADAKKSLVINHWVR